MRATARLLPVLLLALLAAPVLAQDGYRVPPDELARLVDAPSTPVVSLSPDRSRLAVLPRQELPAIRDLARPELRLAGLRIDPRNFGPSRAAFSTGITLVRLSDGSESAVAGLPGDVRVGDFAWSPDGSRLAFEHVAEDRIELWVVDVESAGARRLTDLRLNGAISGSSFTWAPDGASLLARVVPAGVGEAPAAPEIPATPVIQEAGGDAAPAWTYQDLLSSPYDEDLFAHHATADLVRIGLDGSVRTLVERVIVTSFDPSPDGRFVLARTAHRPFSYLVPLSRFPTRTEVLDRDGAPVFLLADLPAAENVPTGFGSVPTGPRAVLWRPDRPATLAWIEAQDGGDARAEADVRDALFDLEAPFDGGARRLAELPLRYAGARWSRHGYALVSEGWFATRIERTWRVPTDEPGPSTVIFEGSSEDRFADPGNPMMQPDGRGGTLLVSADDGRTIFLAGAGATPDGERPFVRRYDLETGRVEEIFRSQDPWYESPVAVLDAGTGRLLVTRESADRPPNWAVREPDGSFRAVTDLPHPHPDLPSVTREIVTFERADGLPLTATLYLPPGYDAGRDGPLPTLVWAYPREFKSAAAAGQVSRSPYRFTRISPSGGVPFVLRGYAVLDDASMPIVGEGDEEPNDAFVDQLVMNAEAVIREGVRRGVVDPDRVAVAGHSYGAFMTANLLAHSDLFRAGIARSGAYNRTLTPFGFQSEERTFWEAPDVYFTMSPFMHADRIGEPILLIHGMADNNSGTFPIQSERFYAALKGHGATARLVLLPHESHGYRARESVLHMLWEESDWLDTHVRGAAPGEPRVKDPTG
jgi:dipeptidyl aminopeptidase/acylaminoacyl peptidase